jgi:hypothetical protein
MFWFGSSFIIDPVAVITFNANNIKTKERGRGAGFSSRRNDIGMTTVTINHGMRTKKRETALLVYLGNISYYPRFWGMTSGTIESNSLLMNISMAGIAFSLYFSKFKRNVTSPTGNILMLTYKWKFRNIMIEWNSF